MKCCDHCWMMVMAREGDCVHCRVHLFEKSKRYALWLAEVTA